MASGEKKRIGGKVVYVRKVNRQSTAAQREAAESAAQLRDTIYSAALKGARYYEYKDASGKTVTGETYKAFTGEYRERVQQRATINRAYKAEYDTDVAKYAEMPDAQLEAELKRYQSQSNDADWAFRMGRAHSALGGAAMRLLDAEKEIGMINRVLERRKKGGMYKAIRL